MKIQVYLISLKSVWAQVVVLKLEDN